MTEVRYTESHEWARLEDDGTITCGITQHAADELNELTFIDFQVAAGDAVSKGGTVAEIETVKATAELYAPLDGTIEAVNERFASEDELSVVSESPMDEGWLFKIKPSDAAQHGALLDQAAYEAHCANS